MRARLSGLPILAVGTSLFGLPHASRHSEARHEFLKRYTSAPVGNLICRHDAHCQRAPLS